MFDPENLTRTNPCIKHGDLARTKAPYTLEVAKGKQPNGTCNSCWAYYNAVQAALEIEAAKAPAQDQLTGAARLRRGRN